MNICRGHVEKPCSRKFLWQPKMSSIHSVFYPNSMNTHSTPTSGLTWEGGLIPYSSLFQALTMATTNFAHLYSKGDDKCSYISSLLGRPVQNLDSFGCPSRKKFTMTTGCSLPCQKFSDKSCSVHNAISFRMA